MNFVFYMKGIWGLGNWALYYWHSYLNLWLWWKIVLSMRLLCTCGCWGSEIYLNYVHMVDEIDVNCFGVNW